MADNCGAACAALASKYPERFNWTPVISKPMACTAVAAAADEQAPPPAFVQGRVSTAVPALLGDSVSSATHFHLVGNGQFVVDFQKGLLAGGVAEGRVTTEKYFNGKAEPDAAVVEFVAEQLRAGRSAPVL